MKEEWKPDTLRETAEEIRSAVMPKSITPEMVGGTLLALTNAVGEVVETLGEIPREHVKVTVRGYDESGEISCAGAKIYIDRWCNGEFPVCSFPREEITADENGTAEFDVPFGFKFAVFSKVEGLGASFQWVFAASQCERKLDLWNQPIGIYAQWCIGFWKEDSEYYPYLPGVMKNGDETPCENSENIIAPTPPGYEPDETYFWGVLISTADTSFVIPENDNGCSMSDERMTWANNRNMRGLIPTLPAYGADWSLQGDEWINAYNEARQKAQMDFDGNMNTAKITAFCKSAPAADWAEQKGEMWQEQRWLPSAGQLYLIYENRVAIDKILTDYGNDCHHVSALNKYYWSSTQFNEYCSWVVGCNGSIDTYYRRNTGGVRAVSAFHFEY